MRNGLAGAIISAGEALPREVRDPPHAVWLLDELDAVHPAGDDRGIGAIET